MKGRGVGSAVPLCGDASPRLTLRSTRVLPHVRGSIFGGLISQDSGSSASSGKRTSIDSEAT